MAKFKKGQSGNPSGRPKLPPEVLVAKQATSNEITLIFNRLMFMTDAELKLVLMDPKTPKFERAIARVLDKAEQFGDPARLEFLLNRTIGKVTDNIKHVYPNVSVLECIGGEEIVLGVEKKDGEK